MSRWGPSKPNGVAPPSALHDTPCGYVTFFSFSTVKQIAMLLSVCKSVARRNASLANASRKQALRSFGTDAAMYDTVNTEVAAASVKVTFVDYLGQRHTKHGHVGQTLVDVCRMYDMDLLECDTVHGGGHRYEIVHNDVWTEDVFGESAVSNLSHVVVSNEWLAKLPPASPAEVRCINELDDDVKTSNSRLGSEIVLTKDLDGIVVNVPDPPPSDIP